MSETVSFSDSSKRGGGGESANDDAKRRTWLDEAVKQPDAAEDGRVGPRALRIADVGAPLTCGGAALYGNMHPPPHDPWTSTPSAAGMNGRMSEGARPRDET